MPLGFISNEELASEMNRFGIAPSGEEQPARADIIEFKQTTRGRGNKSSTPESVRAFIASEAIAGASPDVLSEELNISKSSISAYKNAATSTASYNNPDENLAREINNVRARIIGPAQAKIISAINSITEEKLNGSKARDAASIASAMSTVVKNLSPELGKESSVKIAIFAPRKSEEEDYEIITVNE